MRAAPSVEVQAALRGGWWLAASGLWLVAALSLLGWLVWHGWVEGAERFTAQLPWLLVCLLAGLVGLSSAGTALWHARRFPARLRWDGQAWHCTVPGHLGQEPVPGQVDLMLDVGDAMLLRWRSHATADQPARTVWLPVARSAQPAAWHGLRAALHRLDGGRVPV